MSPQGIVSGEGREVYYRCQRCTECCRWPGDVCLGEGEAERIAKFLGMPLDEFIRTHTRLRANRSGLSLVDKDDRSHECIMLVDDVCRIHEVKPMQCRGFPNRWNFPGWEKICQAKTVRRS